MVKVPEYQRTETLRPAYRQDIDIRATPEAFGAAVGRGLQQVGGAVGQAAEAVSKIQEFDNENSAKDADNAFANWARERMYGEGGYLTMSGRNAVEGRTQFEKDVEAKRREFGASLNPGASRMYDRAAQARVMSLQQQAVVHQASERKSWFRETSDARRVGFANDALANAGNAAMVQKNITAGILELDSRGQLEGWSPEELARQKSNYTSGVHTGVATQIADKDPIAADKYLSDNKTAFLPSDALKLKNMIEAPLRQARTRQAVDGFEKSLPPLDMSGGAVGGSYDVVLGNGQYGRPSKPITQMSMGEVINFGQNVLIPNSKAAGVGRDARGLLGSSAVGAYQITQETLNRYGPRVLGENWRQTAFTPDVQDRIAEAIFNDSKSLGAGMSKVWASLSPAQAARVSAMPWSQAKGIIAAGESGGSSSPRKPGETPEGWLTGMYAKADKIADPDMRDAAYAEIDKRYGRMAKTVAAGAEVSTKAIEDRMIADPNFNPDTIPIAVQQQIGQGKMDSYRSTYKRNQTVPDIQSDAVVKDRLLTDYHLDPGAFANRDLSPEMEKLSPKDYQWFRGKQQEAKGNLAKAVREGTVYNNGKKAAGEFYRAAGIATSGKAAQSAENQARKAQYHAAINEQIDAYVEKNGAAPTFEETRKIAAALSLSVTGSETRSKYSPMRLFDDGQDDVTDGYAYQRGKFTGLNVRPNPSFANIPPDMVEPIRNLLKRQGVANPSNSQIADEWGKQAVSIIRGK